MVSRVFLLVSCLVICCGELVAQKNCGTVTYQDMLKKASHPEPTEVFEQWMSSKLKEQSLSPGNARVNRLNQIITIPVVVHIIHNGEPLGNGSNIHDNRIFEQIQRLNEDFRRQNADAVNTPPEFLGVAADTEIEFVLAQRDPWGLPTTGIVRVPGNRPVYDLVHNTELKALSYWPAEDYMNLWVAELDNLLGYAQFPISSTLQGLEIASENRLTDGVVIDTDFFGVNPGLTPESIGRTCTHEVGHFLGLRHTWGDGGCSVDDFCEDTPRSNSSNFGCPDVTSCGSKDMVQNYMDLSDDLCMNLFTICQKNRMRVVLSNSPRRLSLVTSKGLLPPVMVDNDAGIREITMPQTNTCTSSVSPRVEVQNAGTNIINSFTVELSYNGSPVETLQVTNTLDPLEITTVNFSSIQVADMADIAISIKATNGGTDGNPENDSKAITLEEKLFTSLPFTEPFNSIPGDWEIRNGDNSITWEVVNAPSDLAGNTAARVNFFSYDNSNGEYDYLITPSMDLTTYTGLTLQFDVAYSPFSPGDKDGLIVAISDDCGNSFSTQNYAFFKQGMDLATAPISASSFVPSGRSQWRTETVNLDQYAGFSHLQIAFISINDFGNNLYLDNISVSGTRVPDLDMGVVSIQAPSGVMCPTGINPSAVVRNTGLNTVNSFQVSYVLESGASGQLDYSGPPLAAGETAQVIFDAISVPTGADKITVNIDQVEGQGNDGMQDNNILEQPFLVDDSRDRIPLIEEFALPLGSSDWMALNPDNGITWSVTAANRTEEAANQAAYLNFFAYDSRGEIDYMSSPVLDFSSAVSPAMTFDLAYAGNSNFNDGLLILASADCGANYTDTVFQAFGPELATVTSSGEFFPDDPSDWELQQIDLSKFKGKSEVRLAFVGVNDFGNNLFIDNIQFFCFWPDQEPGT